MQRNATGAVAGFLATLPMTGAMSGLHRHLPPRDRYPLPPRLLTEQMVATQPEAVQRRATALAHYAYGAASAALYPLYAEHLGGRSIAGAAGFGVLVWAGSYMGWIPALGLLAPASRHPAPRVALMIAAHALWGAATGLAAQALSDDRPPSLTRAQSPAPTLERTARSHPARIPQGSRLLWALLGVGAGVVLVTALDRLAWHHAPFSRHAPSPEHHRP